MYTESRLRRSTWCYDSVDVLAHGKTQSQSHTQDTQSVNPLESSYKRSVGWIVPGWPLFSANLEKIQGPQEKAKVELKTQDIVKTKGVVILPTSVPTSSTSSVFVSPFVCLCMRVCFISAWLSACLVVCLPCCLPVLVSVCLSFCLSTCLLACLAVSGGST